MNEDQDEEPPRRRRVHWDGTINAGHVLQALVIIGAALAFYGAQAANQAATDARLSALERDSGAGARITAALRDLVDQQQVRIATLETQQTNILDRIDREYADAADFKKNMTDGLDALRNQMSDVRSSVAAIATAVTGNPGARP